MAQVKTSVKGLFGVGGRHPDPNNSRKPLPTLRTKNKQRKQESGNVEERLPSRSCTVGQRSCQRNGFRTEPEGKRHLELLPASHPLICKCLSSVDLSRKPASKEGVPDDVVQRAQLPGERIELRSVENESSSINRESVHYTPLGHPASSFALQLSDENLISNTRRNVS